MMAAATQDVETGAAAAAPSEETPLVNFDDLLENDPTADDDKLGDIEKSTRREKVVSGAAVATVASSAGAMLTAGNPIVYVSGLMGVGVAPYAVVQQKKVTQVIALKETNEHLEHEIGNLKKENDRLQSTLGELEGSVQHLQDMEEALVTIRESESQSLDALEGQLKDSRDILSKMQKNLKATVLQNLISLILGCDKDGDMKVSDDELDGLLAKVEGIHGVDVHEDRLKAKLTEKGRSLNAVMEVVRNIIDDDTVKNDMIFDFDGE